MSTKTDLTVFESELAKLADQGVKAERSTAGASFMSTKGGVLSYREVPIAGNSIEVVIIASPIERLYYADRYDPTKISGPACFGIAALGTGMAPSSVSPSIQNATCQGCPKDEWGSAANGGRGKACRETRRILMVTADSIPTPESVITAEVAALRPPVTSLKGFATYLQTIAAGMRRPLCGVVTQISVVPDPKNQFRVEFKFINALENLDIIKALIERGNQEVVKAVASAGMEESLTPEAQKSNKF